MEAESFSVACLKDNVAGARLGKVLVVFERSRVSFIGSALDLEVQHQAGLDSPGAGEPLGCSISDTITLAL